MGALNLRQTWRRWAEEEEDCLGGAEITAEKAGESIRRNSSEMISVNVGKCGWMYEEMMTI